MRRLTACVLTMALLLAACGPAGETPEDAAAVLQNVYRDMAGCTASVELTADYGERVYEFAVDVSYEREGETVLTVTGPELLAGITARVRDGETLLEYDGAGFSLGELDGDGTTPLSAVADLLREASEGYMAQCSWAGEGESLLQVLCRDPETAPGAGTEFLITFDRATKALLEAEVSSAGRRVLTARFHDFTFLEMTDDDTGDGPDLG